MNAPRILPAWRSVGLLVGVLVLKWQVTAIAANPTIDFSHEVVPILKAHCVECHGGEEAEGGFSLNTRALMLDAGVVEPGDVDASPLIERVVSDDPELRMPPEDHDPLPAESIEVLRRWVQEELLWEAGFTFAAESRYEPPLEPRRPELPPARDGRSNPIDRILDAYLAERQTPRPEPLGDAQFLRRASFDLVGLPPTPERLAAFLANDATNKRAEVIDELLERREAFATHWLTFWNDLLRNAYRGTGFGEGGRKQITKWLYKSLLKNKPFDQFIRELISPTPESEGFISGFVWRGNVNASQTPEVQFAQNIGQVFLGINLKCASCHDSFIDRWTLEETYSLAAVYATGPLELHRCDKPQGIQAESGWLFPELGAIDPAASQQERLRQLAALMTHPQNGRVNRTIVNRLWHRLMGRGVVHPVDAMNTEPWSSDLLDYLAVYLTDHDYDLQAVLRLIATSEAYQSRCANAEKELSAGEYVYAGPIAKRMTVEQFLDSIWTITASAPKPQRRWFKVGGGGREGQLSGILAALEYEGEDRSIRDGADDAQQDPAALKRRWGDRPLRAALMPLDLFQAGLGRPNRDQVVTARPAGLTTLEAIMLSNGAEMTEFLSAAAENVQQRDFQSPHELVEWLYLATLSRRPTTSERELLAGTVGAQVSKQSIEDILWSVFLLPEFQLIR